MPLPFEPGLAVTVNINVSSSSQSVPMNAACGQNVLITNDGTATVWINFGGSTVTAAVATGIPITPGSAQVFTIPQLGITTAPYMAAIAAGATGKVYATPGNGI